MNLPRKILCPLAMLVWSHYAHMGPLINSYFSFKVSLKSPWQDTSSPWGQQSPPDGQKRENFNLNIHPVLDIFWLETTDCWQGLLGSKGPPVNFIISLHGHKPGHQKQKPVTFMSEKSRGVYFPLCPTLRSLKKREIWLFKFINNAKPEEGASCTESRQREIAKSRICW